MDQGSTVKLRIERIVPIKQSAMVAVPKHAYSALRLDSRRLLLQKTLQVQTRSSIRVWGVPESGCTRAIVISRTAKQICVTGRLRDAEYPGTIISSKSIAVGQKTDKHAEANPLFRVDSLGKSGTFDCEESRLKWSIYASGKDSRIQHSLRQAD